MNPDLLERLSAMSHAQDPTFQIVARTVIKSNGKNKPIISSVVITTVSAVAGSFTLGWPKFSAVPESFTLGWFKAKGVMKLEVTIHYSV